MNTLKNIAYVLAVLFFIRIPLYPKSLCIDRNIYSSGGVLKVGDVINVRIEDISQMRFSISVNNNDTFSIASNPDVNITGFLPKVSSDKQVRSSDRTDFSGRGTMVISIAARVTGRLRDGKLKISGSRQYSFNGLASSFVVSGIVDPSLISGRSILSNDIADFMLEVRGTKEGARIGLKRLKLKEGESASAALTEEEKQRIILEYLKKMIGELTR
jgi:flagellar basal body L-ring protein FlgH